jgi:hypothetical protein
VAVSELQIEMVSPNEQSSPLEARSTVKAGLTSYAPRIGPARRIRM